MPGPRSVDQVTHVLAREDFDLRAGVSQVVDDKCAQRVDGDFVIRRRLADDKFFGEIDDFVVVFAEEVE
jgi:hypothetical protein